MLDCDPAPITKKGHRSPATFEPMDCGQTAGWITMPLGAEVGLNPGHIVLDGDQLPQRGAAPNFWPMCTVAKRLDGSRRQLIGR